jgi:predicted RNase H-like nuclease (RuvC/YqgF family)
MGARHLEAAMELIERIELLEEQFEGLNKLVWEKYAALLDSHGDLLRELRREVASLIVSVTVLEQRVNALAERTGALEKRIEILERRIEALEKRIEALELQLQRLEHKVDRMDARSRRVEIIQWVTLAILVPQALIFYLRLLSP